MLARQDRSRASRLAGVLPAWLLVLVGCAAAPSALVITDYGEGGEVHRYREVFERSSFLWSVILGSLVH